jgi:hypothetical protein
MVDQETAGNKNRRNREKRFGLLLKDILEDLIDNISSGSSIPGFLLKIFFLVPALTFANQMIRYDNRIGRNGLKEASAWLFKKFYQDARTAGVPYPNGEGLLITAQHPGIGDALAFFATFPGENLTIVAKDRVFYHQLPHLRRHLILVGGADSVQSNGAAKIKDRLKAKGTVLLYPAGVIEPDPARVEVNRPVTRRWSKVIGMVCSLADREGWSFSVQPLLTSNVIPRRAVESRFARRKTSDEEKDKAAVSYTIMTRCSRGETVSLSRGRIFESGELAATSSWSEVQEIIRREVELLRSDYPGQELLDAKHALFPVRELRGTV